MKTRRDRSLTAADLGGDAPEVLSGPDVARRPRSAGALRATETGLAMTDELRSLKDDITKSERTGIRLIEIPVDRIDEGLIPDRSARGFDDQDFSELQRSIQADGQDQPIVVREGADGRYELISGRRRTEACRRLGKNVIARVKPLDDRAALAEQFRENGLRANLTAIELGIWLVKIRDKFELKGVDLEQITGFAKGYVSELQRLGALSPDILSLFEDYRAIDKASGLAISRKLDDAKMAAAIDKKIDQIRGAGTDRQRIQMILSADQKATKSQAKADEVLARGGKRLAKIDFVRGKPRVVFESELDGEKIERLKEFIRSL